MKCMNPLWEIHKQRKVGSIASDAPDLFSCLVYPVCPKGRREAAPPPLPFLRPLEKQAFRRLLAQLLGPALGGDHSVHHGPTDTPLLHQRRHAAKTKRRKQGPEQARSPARA